MPKDADDERLKIREFLLLPQLQGWEMPRTKQDRISMPNLPERDSTPTQHRFEADPIEESKAPVPRVVPIRRTQGPTEESHRETIDERINQAILLDPAYELARKAVQEKQARFPRELKLQIDISECDIDEQGLLRFRGRIWVPNHEPLRTGLIQEAHDSKATGHPGKGNLNSLVARTYYWPKMANDTAKFVKNCEICGGGQVWRERRQGLLKPLPILERIWSEISMDFITKLPASKGCTNVLVITDRLSKDVIFIPMKEITTETVAWAFIRYHLPYHGLPEAIVSDRGSQFVGQMWKRICDILKIRRRLSTAWHPETDGSTERKNEDIEFYFRAFCNYDQSDWHDLCPLAQLVCNTRVASAIGVSPYFLQHGYNFEPWDIPNSCYRRGPARSPVQKADAILTKLNAGFEHAKLAMAAAQEKYEYEYHANKKRMPARQYQADDEVWLDLRNIKTDRPSKKLDMRHMRCKVIERIGSHAYRLDTPMGVHNVFNTMLLRPAVRDPLPSQRITEYRKAAILVDGELEYEVNQILKERRTKTGGHQYLVDWTGWPKPTWEPASTMAETAALDDWERENEGTMMRRQRRGGKGE